MRKWLAAVLVGSMLTAGCMGGGGGGQQPQQAPEPSEKQIQGAVEKSLHDDDMKDYLRTQVRTQAGAELLEMALDTQDGQRLVQDAVKRSMNSAAGQQAIINKVGEMMSDPTFKTQITQAIKETLMEIMAKGAETPGKKKEGKEEKGGKDKEKEKGGGKEEGGGGGGGGN